MTKPDWFRRLQKFPIGIVGEFLGTRSSDDPQARAARRWLRRLFKVDAEQLAVFSVLMDKGIITKAEYLAAVQTASETLCRELEHEFPGFTAHDDGVGIDVRLGRVTTKDWPK